MIPYNPVDEHGYKQSLGHTITAFKDELIRLHINCTLRKEHGRDIDGACGQLRKKREKGHNMVISAMTDIGIKDQSIKIEQFIKSKTMKSLVYYVMEWVVILQVMLQVRL